MADAELRALERGEDRGAYMAALLRTGWRPSNGREVRGKPLGASPSFWVIGIRNEDLGPPWSWGQERYTEKFFREVAVSLIRREAMRSRTRGKSLYAQFYDSSLGVPYQEVSG